MFAEIGVHLTALLTIEVAIDEFVLINNGGALCVRIQRTLAVIQRDTIASNGTAIIHLLACTLNRSGVGIGSYGLPVAEFLLIAIQVITEATIGDIIEGEVVFNAL